MNEPGEPITVMLRRGPGSLGRPRMKILFDDDPDARTRWGLGRSRQAGCSCQAVFTRSRLAQAILRPSN